MKKDDPFALARAGHAKRAVELFEKMIERGEMRAAGWLVYGGALEDLHRYEDAIDAFRRARAHRIAPKWKALALGFEGRMYKELGKLDAAIRSFRHCVRVKSTPQGWTYLGVALVDRDGWTAKSARCFEEAIALEEDYEEAHYNLGCNFLENGRYELAERHLRRAIEIDRRYAYAYAQLGRCVMKDGKRLSEARRLLRRSIALDPKHGWARLYLAIASWTFGDEEGAEEQYRAAIRLSPKWHYARVLYGDFLSATDRVTRGGAQLRKALAMHPDCAPGHYYLAKHRERVGDTEGAALAMAKAAKLGDARARKALRASD